MKTHSELRKAVRILNAHHMRTCAGFYPSTGGRAFIARFREGEAQISYDHKTFVPVDLENVKFHDHNGQPITTFPLHR